MKTPLLPLTRLVLGTVAGISVSLLLPQPSWAQQANDVAPLQDFDPQGNDDDPFSRTDQGDSLGIFDLIHRARLNNNRDPGEYSTEQNESLDAAAAKFREMQRQRIQGQPQGSPIAPVTGEGAGQRE